MFDDWLPGVEKALLGQRCENVRRESEWTLTLVGGGSIALPLPWRIVVGGRIAFANEDDGQWFGLSSPVDGPAKATSLVGLRPITGIVVDHQTLDLVLYFDNGIRLDAFSNSSGYEGWRIHVLSEVGSMSIVALGGGEVAIY